MADAVNTTIALIAHRQNEADLLTDRARQIWDLAHVHGLSVRAIRDRLTGDLEARGVAAEQIERMGVSQTQVHRIVSGPRP